MICYMDHMIRHMKHMICYTQFQNLLPRAALVLVPRPSYGMFWTASINDFLSSNWSSRTRSITLIEVYYVGSKWRLVFKVTISRIQYTYVRVVCDDTNTCLVLTDGHSFNQAHNIFTDILEVLFFDWTGWIEDEVEIDSEIILKKFNHVIQSKYL